MRSAGCRLQVRISRDEHWRAAEYILAVSIRAQDHRRYRLRTVAVPGWLSKIVDHDRQRHIQHRPQHRCPAHPAADPRHRSAHPLYAANAGARHRLRINARHARQIATSATRRAESGSHKRCSTITRNIATTSNCRRDDRNKCRNDASRAKLDPERGQQQELGPNSSAGATAIVRSTPTSSARPVTRNKPLISASTCSGAMSSARPSVASVRCLTRPASRYARRMRGST